MIALARRSLRRPAAALLAWIGVAVALCLILLPPASRRNRPSNPAS
jgi:hypothetical protein